MDNEALLSLARAQVDANRLKQDELNLERRRQAIPLQVIEAAASLSQEIRFFLPEVKKDRETFYKNIIWLDKVYEDLSNRLERLEHLVGLLLVEGNSDRKREAGQELEQEASIRRQISKRRRNLNKLKEQAAEHGSDVPLGLQNQIEAEEAEITRLEKELQ